MASPHGAAVRPVTGNLTPATDDTAAAVRVMTVDTSGAYVAGGGGGGGGTEYTEGATDATITGPAVMWEDTGDTLRAVSAAKPLPVNVVSGSGSGTEYSSGDTPVTPTGGLAFGRGSNTEVYPLLTSSNTNGLLLVETLNSANDTATATLTDGGTTSTTFSSFDLSSYRWLAIQGLAGASGASLSAFEQSLNGTDWFTVNVFRPGTAQSQTTDVNDFSFADGVPLVFVAPVIGSRVRLTLNTAADPFDVTLVAYTSDPMPWAVGSSTLNVTQANNNGGGSAWYVQFESTPTVNIGSQPVEVLSTPALGATSALTQVGDSASSVTILASNTNRISAVITNDSSARLYLRYEAAAASTTAYTVSLAQHETVTVTDYSGEIRGIWATDPNDGAARVTEITA